MLRGSPFGTTKRSRPIGPAYAASPRRLPARETGMRSGNHLWRRPVRGIHARLGTHPGFPNHRQSPERRRSQPEGSAQNHVCLDRFDLTLRRGHHGIVGSLLSPFFHRATERTGMLSVESLAQPLADRSLPNRVTHRHAHPCDSLQHRPLRADGQHQRAGQNQLGGEFHGATVSLVSDLSRRKSPAPWRDEGEDRIGMPIRSGEKSPRRDQSGRTNPKTPSRSPWAPPPISSGV